MHPAHFPRLQQGYQWTYELPPCLGYPSVCNVLVSAAKCLRDHKAAILPATWNAELAEAMKFTFLFPNS